MKLRDISYAIRHWTTCAQTGRSLPFLFVALALIWSGAAQAEMFLFDFHGNPMGYSVKLPQGGSIGFQYCVTPEIIKAINHWPGTPVAVSITWTQNGAAPWGGQAPGLPLTTTMVGPISDGRYCSNVMTVKYSDFPNQGVWQAGAQMPGTGVGTLMTRWTLLPPKMTIMKPKTMTPKMVPHPAINNGNAQSGNGNSQLKLPSTMSR
jgi:hypothetical protein